MFVDIVVKYSLKDHLCMFIAQRMLWLFQFLGNQAVAENNSHWLDSVILDDYALFLCDCYQQLQWITKNHNLYSTRMILVAD